MSSIFLRHKQEKRTLKTSVVSLQPVCCIRQTSSWFTSRRHPMSVTRHRPCTLFTPVVHFTAHIAEASTILRTRKEDRCFLCSRKM